VLAGAPRSWAGQDPDKVVSVAGKALCALAVRLDDLIDSEEMRLLPR